MKKNAKHRNLKVIMSIKQKIIMLATTALLALSFSLAVSSVASASDCGGVKTSVISCSGDDGKTGLENSGVWSLLLIAINILVAGVGVLALAGIVYGAILYTSAGGNPEQVKKAIGIFTNVAIGVIAFAGMYVLLNFIVPGGVFN